MSSSCSNNTGDTANEGKSSSALVSELFDLVKASQVHRQTDDDDQQSSGSGSSSDQDDSESDSPKKIRKIDKSNHSDKKKKKKKQKHKTKSYHGNGSSPLRDAKYHGSRENRDSSSSAELLRESKSYKRSRSSLSGGCDKGSVKSSSENRRYHRDGNSPIHSMRSEPVDASLVVMEPGSKQWQASVSPEQLLSKEMRQQLEVIREKQQQQCLATAAARPVHSSWIAGSVKQPPLSDCAHRPTPSSVNSELAIPTAVGSLDSVPLTKQALHALQPSHGGLKPSLPTVGEPSQTVSPAGNGRRQGDTAPLLVASVGDGLQKRDPQTVMGAEPQDIAVTSLVAGNTVAVDSPLVDAGFATPSNPTESTCEPTSAAIATVRRPGIVIKSLKNSAVFEATLRQVAEEDRKREASRAHIEEGELSDSTPGHRSSPSLPSDDPNDDGEIVEKDKKSSRRRKRSKEHSSRNGDKSSRSEDKSSRSEDKSSRSEDKSSRSEDKSSRSRHRSGSRRRRSRSGERSHRSPRRHHSSKRSSRRRSRSRDRSSHRDKRRRSIERYDIRSRLGKSDERSSSRREKSAERSSSRRGRSRSRSRSRSRPFDARDQIDKQRLLEVARRNAQRLMEAGALPAHLTVPTQAPSGQYAGANVNQLTAMCRRLRDEAVDDRQSGVDGGNFSSEAVGEAGFNHPFAVRERSSAIVMNIRNAPQLPVKTHSERQTEMAKVSSQFPVSSGEQHRNKELEWVPVKAGVTATATDGVDSPADPASVGRSGPLAVSSAVGAASQPTAATSALPAATTPVPAADRVFPVNSQMSVELNVIVSERLSAMRDLQRNPSDPTAQSRMNQAVTNMQLWSSTGQTTGPAPGQFTGSTGARMLSAAELTSGYQAWARKDQLKRSAPVSGGFGEQLLKRMGWQPGRGLGKNQDGSLEPLMLDVKTDKRGLVAEDERKGGRRNQQQIQQLMKQHQLPNDATAGGKNIAGKNPVSVLVELCSKRRWKPPEFDLAFDSGPDHKKHFLFKVTVNGVSYQPSASSNNKKLAKANTAAAALQALGLLPTATPGL